MPGRAATRFPKLGCVAQFPRSSPFAGTAQPPQQFWSGTDCGLAVLDEGFGPLGCKSHGLEESWAQTKSYLRRWLLLEATIVTGYSRRTFRGKFFAKRQLPEGTNTSSIMADEILRDRNGFRIGTIETRSDRTQVLRDKNASRLGEYDPRTNITRDRNSSRVGEGNLLATLLR